MKYFKKLVGEKVYLSPVNSGDIEIFAKWMNDFGITDYTLRSHNLYSLECEKEWVAIATSGKSYIFSIVKLENDELIGTIEIANVDHVNRTASLGILIGESEERSKGYGREALNLVIEFAFNYLNLHSINLRVLADNERAKKCYTNVGFKEIGRERECRFVGGKYHDIIHMDILDSEFKGGFIKNKNL